MTNSLSFDFFKALGSGLKFSYCLDPDRSDMYKYLVAKIA